VAPTPKSLGPYGFHLRTEAALATMCSSHPSFFARIGAQLDPDALVSVPARWAVKAAQEIVRETGNPPGSSVLVLQRLQRWSESGTVLYEEVEDVSAMFDACEDIGLPPEDGLLSEVVPVVQKRLQHLRTLDLISEKGPAGLDKVIAGLEEVKNLGSASAVSDGVFLGSTGLSSVIQPILNLKRLALDVPELDEAMNHGLWRGALGLVIGSTGSGKSLFLSHAACSGGLAGHLVLFATLELSPQLIIARVAANVTGIPIDNVLNGSLAQAEAKFKEVVGRAGGNIVVNYFTAHTTTVKELRAWVDRVEARLGRKADLLVVDYADKLTTSSAASKEEKGGASQYVAQREVYQGLRGLAVDKDLWVWTASQARRQTEKRSKNYKLDNDDASDSAHKTRESDMVVTLNPRDENKTLLFHIAKNRMGTGGESAGPMPHDFALGRIGPVNR